jgi:hypothetical protein
MKKKLLITLGCSCTEGVGCYDLSINPDKISYLRLPPNDLILTRKRFHKLGWPNRVGKKINAHRVLNLGLGGSSNSSHLKLFQDKIVPQLPKLQEEYEIFLIWMMTNSTRFSFYTKHGIGLFNPVSVGLSNAYLPMEQAYIDTMDDMKVGPAREDIFYIKISEILFKYYNIKAVYTSWSMSFKAVYEYYLSDSFLMPTPHFLMSYIHTGDRRYMSEVCDHPNEEGYELWSNKIIQALELYHPEFIKGKPVDNFTYEWIGDNVYGAKKRYMYGMPLL